MVADVGQQDGERLADLVVKTRFPDLLDVDVVGLLQDLNLIARDRAKDTDGQAGAGEGMALNEVVGD